MAQSDTSEYVFAGEMPEFQGDYVKFLVKNVIYPREALENCIEGKVYVNFVVDTNGTVTDLAIAKGVHQLLDQEALRVVGLTSGNWKPGRQYGKAVRVRMTLPIHFKYGSGGSLCLEKFRTGTFTYKGKEDEVKIIRTKKEQIEIYNNGQSKLILKIEWPTDSTYVLTHKKSVNAPGCLEKGDWIKSTITKYRGNEYTVQYTSNKCGDGQSDLIKLD